jgi:peroxiredoxin
MKKIAIFCFMALFLAASVFAQEEPGLQVGIQAPDFEALTYQGVPVKLSDINKEGPVVLIFYRGGWCMYCNRQLQALQSRLDDFNDLGASIVAISVDLQENAAKTVEEKQLGFTVISDPGAHLLELYGLIYQVPDDIVKQYEGYQIDLKAASGRDDHIISIPATYVIDRAGKIVFAYANRDYKIRKSPDEILEVLRAIEQ